MNKKLSFLCLCGMLALQGCGSSDSSPSNATGDTSSSSNGSQAGLSEYPSKSALPKCMDKEGLLELANFEVVKNLDVVTCDVTDEPVIFEKSVYECEDGERILSYSYAKEKESAIAAGKTYTCTNGEWSLQKSEDKDDESSCTTGEVKDQKVCMNGTWIDPTKPGNDCTTGEVDGDKICVNGTWVDFSTSGGDECTTGEMDGSKVCINGEWIDVGTGNSSSSTTSSSSNKGSSSSSVPKSSSSVVTVALEDGIIWKPSYGTRANTGFINATDETFMEECEDENCGGWWYKYLDEDDFGLSKATGIFNESYLQLKISLVYSNWSLEGYGTSTYYAPDPYPYAGFGFNLADQKKSVDITELGEGVCITYTADNPVKLVIVSQSTASDAAHYKYTLSASTSTKTINIPFTSFKQPSWYSKSVARTTALGNAQALQIQYTNDEAGVTNFCSTLSSCVSYGSYSDYTDANVQIYKIGKYGTCTSGSSTL